MHAVAFMCINQQTKFEVPNFTISKDMIVQNLKKTGNVTLITLVVCHLSAIGYDIVI